MLMGPKHLWNLHENNFLKFSITLKEKNLKMPLLVICETLEVFVNTLTVNDKYPLWSCENLLLPSQMQLSKNRKSFFSIFCFISRIYIKF